MTLIKSASLACVSALLIASSVSGARPQYAGTLRMAIESTPRAIDPYAPADAPMARQIYPLLFETLLAVDPAGGLQPRLALTWASAPGGWRIQLRPQVRLHDGVFLDAAIVATALRARFPGWRITVAGETMTIDAGSGPPDVPWALAHRGSVIAVRSATGAWLGTGPFRVDRLDPNRLTLTAHDAHWNGRPFVDGIEVALGRSRAMQLSDLEVGHIDLAAVHPTDLRRAEQRQLRPEASKPLDLVVLVFEAHRAADAAASVRRTLAGAFDRTAIARVIAQGQAEPATTLLPLWIGGYTVSPEAGRVLTRAAVTALPVDQRTLILRVPAGDPALRAIADRLVVDAQQAGFAMTVQVPSGGLPPRADARLVRIAVDVTTPDRALAGVMAAIGPRALTLAASTPPPAGASIDDVARIERVLADRRIMVPIVHLPEIVAAAPRVALWNRGLQDPGGEWNVADVWVRPAATPVP